MTGIKPSFALLILLLLAACTPATAPDADLTRTAEWYLNGGYPFGHATGLPWFVIDQHMTQTATARGTFAPSATPTPTPDYTAIYILNQTMYAPGGPTGMAPTFAPLASPTPTAQMLTTVDYHNTQWAELTKTAATWTASPTLTPTFTTPNTLESDLTRWAATMTPSAFPSLDHTSMDNTRWAEVAITAAAYGTEHASAPGTLEVPFGLGGIMPRVTLSEADVNVLLAPQFAGVSGVQHVTIDLVPGGAMVRANLPVGRRMIAVSATTLLVIEDGALLLNLTDASAGPVSIPQAALDALNAQVIPAVNRALNDILSIYAPPDLIYPTEISVTNTTLTVQVVILSGPLP